MTTEVFRQLDEALTGVPRVGVIHVGAHRGQEVPDYEAAGFSRIVLVEPNPALWEACERTGARLERCAAGAPGRAVLHVTDWDERSSLLRPLRYPVESTVEVDVRPLSDLQAGCNVAVIDVQGAELEVLVSARMDLLDAVVVERSTVARYAGAASTEDVDGFMASVGWSRTGTYGGHSSASLTDEVWRRA